MVGGGQDTATSLVSHDDSVREVRSESGDGAHATAMGSVEMILVSHSDEA